jgi:RNA 2',3'-cyclic 3'-phosphodiesterase
VRLFLAVELGESVRAEAGRVVEVLRRRGASLAPRARLTWVTADRMHLTVRFIGAADEGRLADVRRALDAPFETPPFALSIEGTGAFPAKGPPRVVWAGLHDGRGHLLVLERELTARLSTIGIPPEDRPYDPHLTLARVRDPAGLRAAALLDGLQTHAFGHSTIDAITLFESRLSPKGPTYVALARAALVDRRV